VSAQTTKGQDQELKTWVKNYKSWQEWRNRWRNFLQFGHIARYRDRKPKPEPPGWLAGECAPLFEDSQGLLAEACVLLKDWEEGPDQNVIQQQWANAHADRPAHTKFWERVNLDGMYTLSEFGSQIDSGGLLGLVGMHLSIELGGRAEIYPFPGVMLLREPNATGGHDISPAYDWGFSIRLFNFNFPGGKPAIMHVNVVKVWTFQGYQAGYNMVGMSMTFKTRQ